MFTVPFDSSGGRKVNTRTQYDPGKPLIRSPNEHAQYHSAGDLDDVRTYGYKASRAAALIYAHFKKEFGMPLKR